eukprot:CAMPEP_0185171442 /NCGR_PEP_ID=MMETSP1139-20130426/20215_1 /TAXON_ID=298111 /ORGANISM="Pavlova sp., Strain CCMP459" /LENGTH=54 /DNA_ID=CAMNT_0027737057 /DNA_START=100 /DNA_END=260 /DNA_ORIENTATION=-
MTCPHPRPLCAESDEKREKARAEARAPALVQPCSCPSGQREPWPPISSQSPANP